MTTISDSQSKSSSSPRSSPLSFPALSPIPTTSSGASKRYSMDEVWRDISLSSLQQPSNSSNSVSTTTFSLALEDSSIQHFLSPLSPNGKRRTRAWHYSTAEGGQHTQTLKESGSGFLAYETAPVAPVLSLDKGTEIHCVGRSHDPSSVVEPQLHAFGKLTDSFRFSRLDPLNHSSLVELSTLCKKKTLESDESTSDHRNKRLMKNRESAARSRARKQAYTTELELKVSRLVEENGRLRRQLEKLCTTAAPAQHPKKHTLQRTLTAPF